MEIPSGFAQVNFVFEGLNVPTGAQCTLGLDVTLGSSSPSLTGEAVLDAVETAEIDAEMTNDVRIVGVLVKYGPVATGPSAFVARTITGSGGENSVAPNTAFLIRKVTNLGGRAGRGRMYWPGVSDQDVLDDGQVIGASITSWQAALDTFYSELGTADLTPVLLHGENSPIGSPTPLIGFEIDAKVATQRRRLRR